MRIPKRYGQSKLSFCPFCTRTATQQNSQGVDVCPHHVKQVLEEIRCICGSWLEQRSGKFGPYFNCVKCGNINFKKAMEIMKINQKGDFQDAEKLRFSCMRTVKESNIESRPVEAISRPVPKEIIITTKDVEYFD